MMPRVIIRTTSKAFRVGPKSRRPSGPQAANEALPHLVMIKEEKLQEKRREIIAENKTLLETFDGIIGQGQKENMFDKDLNPAVMRQVLCGAIERLHYGLFYSTYSDQSIGYNDTDAHQSIVLLIEKFICK